MNGSSLSNWCISGFQGIQGTAQRPKTPLPWAISSLPDSFRAALAALVPDGMWEMGNWTDLTNQHLVRTTSKTARERLGFKHWKRKSYATRLGMWAIMGAWSLQAWAFCVKTLAWSLWSDMHSTPSSNMAKWHEEKGVFLNIGLPQKSPKISFLHYKMITAMSRKNDDSAGALARCRPKAFTSAVKKVTSRRQQPLLDFSWKGLGLHMASPCETGHLGQQCDMIRRSRDGDPKWFPPLRNWAFWRGRLRDPYPLSTFPKSVLCHHLCQAGKELRLAPPVATIAMLETSRNWWTCCSQSQNVTHLPKTPGVVPLGSLETNIIPYLMVRTFPSSNLTWQLSAV